MGPLCDGALGDGAPVRHARDVQVLGAPAAPSRSTFLPQLPALSDHFTHPFSLHMHDKHAPQAPIAWHSSGWQEHWAAAWGGAHLSLTCVDGNADVRSVSCVSSIGRRRGTLSTKAAWSGVAAHAVMRKPASGVPSGRQGWS